MTRETIVRSPLVQFCCQHGVRSLLAALALTAGLVIAESGDDTELVTADAEQAAADDSADIKPYAASAPARDIVQDEPASRR